MKYFFISISILLFVSCNKNIDIEINEVPLISNGADTDTSIFISNDIIIDDREKIIDTIFNYNVYEKFIKTLVASNRFIFVPLNEFDQTHSSEKIVIGMRHDIDYDIHSAVRFARREYRNGVRATYYILHSADYYCDMSINPLIRKPSVLEYMKKLQNEYKHEIGWHNDLVTLQVVYDIDIKKYFTRELAWLRNNVIKINGSSYHGSEYCYIYHYLNNYVWNVFGPQGPPFENYDSVMVNGINKKINKFKFSDFGLKYEAFCLNYNYFFADVYFYNNKRWNMAMFDWDSLKPGDRVIILTHPALWN